MCIKCDQNREFEIAQAIEKQKDMQQDNDNDSISSQLAESNEGNHLMQQNVPSSFTSAAVPLKPSLIDVREARIEHFSRTIHQTIRFRHPIGSPSLSLVEASNTVSFQLADIVGGKKTVR